MDGEGWDGGGTLNGVDLLAGCLMTIECLKD